MEANKVYASVVHFVFNVFKNEKTRTKIVQDEDFAAKVLTVINDILYLEKEHNEKLNDVTWFAEFGKTYVNIVQKKVKFEKPDGQTVDEVYKDYAETIGYAVKTFDVPRNELNNDTLSINHDELKFYQKVTAEMLDKYEDKKTPDVEVVPAGDERKSFAGVNGPNNDPMPGVGFGGGAAGANPGADFIPGYGPMQNPFQNDRFYPFRIKAKHTKWYRILMAVLSMAVAVMMIVATITEYIVGSFTVKGTEFVNSLGSTTVSDAINGGKHFVNSNIGNWSDYGIKWTLSSSLVWTILFMALYVIALIYASLKLFKPVQTYRETYWIQGSVFFFIIIANVFIIFSFYSVFQLIGKDGDDLKNEVWNFYTKKGSVFTNDAPFWGIFDKTETKDSFMAWISKNKIDDAFLSKFNAFRVCLIIFIVVTVPSLVVAIVGWFLNPRLDREKLAKMQNEFARQTFYAQQNQRYDIDPSLYVPEDEYQSVMKKINDRKKAKEDKKKDNADA